MNVTPTSLCRVCLHCRTTYSIGEAHQCDGKPKQDVVLQAPANDEDDLVGAILGERYEIIRFLQGGGMGVVYEARHTVLGKAVAVKIMREMRDKAMQQRFLMEAKSAVTIGHAHIVDVNDFGVLDDGRPYLVMEFLQGEPLDVVIARGPIAAPRVCHIGEQIANGLHAVHDKGILHRDLKPANIFILDRDGKDFVKILDFGIAKVMSGERQSLTGGGAPSPRLTQQGMVMGTAEYMAPEQSTGQELDHRVDEYALGCMLYEMLTGEVPYSGSSVAGVMLKHVTAPLQPPRERRPDLNIPASLEAVVLKAMARERNDRYPNLKGLAAALAVEAEILRGPKESPSRRAMVQTEVAPTLQVRRPRLLFGAMAGVILGMGLLLLLLWPRTPPPAVVPPVAAAAPAPAPAPRAAPAPAADDGPDTPGARAPSRTVRRERPDRGERPDRARPVTVSFENGGEVAIIVECSTLPPCRLPAGGSCQLKLASDSGRCEAHAPGYRARVMSFGDLRGRAKGGRARERLSLDKISTPGGLKTPSVFGGR